MPFRSCIPTLITGFFGGELSFLPLVVPNLFNAGPHLDFLNILLANINLGQTLWQLSLMMPTCPLARSADHILPMHPSLDTHGPAIPMPLVMLDHHTSVLGLCPALPPAWNPLLSRELEIFGSEGMYPHIPGPKRLELLEQRAPRLHPGPVRASSLAILPGADQTANVCTPGPFGEINGART